MLFPMTTIDSVILFFICFTTEIRPSLMAEPVYPEQVMSDMSSPAVVPEPDSYWRRVYSELVGLEAVPRAGLGAALGAGPEAVLPAAKATDCSQRTVPVPGDLGLRGSSAGPPEPFACWPDFA